MTDDEAWRATEISDERRRLEDTLKQAAFDVAVARRRCETLTFYHLRHVKCAEDLAASLDAHRSMNQDLKVLDRILARVADDLRATGAIARGIHVG